MIKSLNSIMRKEDILYYWDTPDNSQVATIQRRKDYWLVNFVGDYDDKVGFGCMPMKSFEAAEYLILAGFIEAQSK